MKRILIIVFLTFLEAASVQGQIYNGFGIKAGTSIANQCLVDYDSNWEYYKVGFTAGIFKDISIIQNLKLQVGINYSRKGHLKKLFEVNSNHIPTGYTYYYHLNYDFITAEFYGKYNFLESRINPYILAGLRLDFFLSSHSFYRSRGVDIDVPHFDNITNNKIFGASLGAGIEYQVSRLFSVFLEGTYNPDFTYISDFSEYLNPYKIRGQSFDIRTGIKF